MPLRNIPIRRKLNVIILVICGVVSVLTCASLLTYEYLTYRQSAVRQISTVGQIVAANSTAALAFANLNDASEILGALKAEPHIESGSLYTRDGKLFARYPQATGTADLPPSAGADGSQFIKSRLEMFLPVAEGDRRLGTLFLRYDMTAIHERMWLYSGIIALVMIFSFGLAYAMSAALQAQISRPILALAEIARAVTERRDYSVRAARFGNDELGMLTDSLNQMLSEIQKLNEELEARVKDRTAKLEEANRELEAFSYSVSHDLRAPLRHVDGFAGLLQKHAERTLDEKGRRFLATISSAARQMGRLIDDLLSFSRINRSSVRMAEFDHDELVAAVVREGRFDKEGRPIEWSISPLPRVRADPAMLRQVWFNLIDNAVKYSGKSARPRVVIKGAKDPVTGEVVFSVADNGVGFDMQYASKLFGVFQRLHGPAEFEGTGIGLANVHRIVARHGGRTWAVGRVGQGATFYFAMPAANGAAGSSSFSNPPIPIPST